MKKEKLLELLELTSKNFKFKIEGFDVFFQIIHEQSQKYADEKIIKNFQQLWLTPAEVWNKKYGYGGYPALADWIDLILGKRPLTDLEIEEQKKEHEKRMRTFTSYIIAWLNDPNLEVSFHRRYFDKENGHLKIMIDEFAGVKEDLEQSRVVKLGLYLKKQLTQNKEAFFFKMTGIAKKQNQLLNEKRDF